MIENESETWSCRCCDGGVPLTLPYSLFAFGLPVGAWLLMLIIWWVAS